MAQTGRQADADLRTYARIVWRRKWWVVGLTVAAVAGALAYVVEATPQYSATAQLLIQPQSGTASITGANDISATDVATELQLLSSTPVAGAVQRQLHLASLGVGSSEVGTTDVLSVTATNADPRLAARIATAYAREFVSYSTAQVVHSLTTAELQLQDQITTIEGKLALTSPNTPQATALANQQSVVNGQLGQLQAYGAAASGGVELVSKASVPTVPTSPKKKTDGLIALVAGLVVGLGVAFIVDYTDDTVRSKDDIELAVADLPVLGTVPRVAGWRDKDQPQVVSLSDPAGSVAEAYRGVRTSLQFAAAGGSVGTVLVTSPAATDGKTATTANLAVALARGGQRVVAVSADLRRPRLGSFLGVDEQVGLTSVVLGQVPLDQALQPVSGVGGLAVLATGPLPPNPAELLGGPEVARILEQLRERFDLVLLDSPPLLPVTDALVLSQRADTVLLVVAAEQTRRGQLAHACERLEQVQARVAGVVLNQASTRASGYGYGYGYGYYRNGASPAAAPGAANGNGKHSGVPAR